MNRAERDLAERLRVSEQHLRERSELLYELQKHYASEHFKLQESMRELDHERMRNAGAYSQLDTVLKRARDLQARVAELKVRLRSFEPVDDAHFDTAPILIEQAPKPSGS